MYSIKFSSLALASPRWHSQMKSNMIQILSCLVSLWLNTISLRVVGCLSHVRVHRPSLDNTLCVQEI